jgi:hypothetical protein
MELFAEQARTFPLRRAGEADEIAGAASTYTTGTILTVDGGAQWSMAGTGEGRPELGGLPWGAPRASLTAAG